MVGGPPGPRHAGAGRARPRRGGLRAPPARRRAGPRRGPRPCRWLGAWRDELEPRAGTPPPWRAVREAIARGDVYQVNVVGHASRRRTPATRCPRCPARPAARRPLRRRADRRRLGDRLRVAGDAGRGRRGGRVVTRPIKGTRPATAAGRRELLASAEGTRRARDDRRPGAQRPRPGSPAPARSGSTSCSRSAAGADLWQAESTVSAALSDGCGLADLLRAVCPGGSVTGAPKLAALAEIARAGAGRPGRQHGRARLGRRRRRPRPGPDHPHRGGRRRAGARVGRRRHHLGQRPRAEVAEAAAKAAPVRSALTGGLRITSPA